MKRASKKNITGIPTSGKVKRGSIVLPILILLSACYYDNEEALYPELLTGCDTTQVSFAGTIKPMLSTNCYGCHSNANASFGNSIKLEDYADVKTYVDNSKLYGSIAHEQGYSSMPKGGGKLETCKITQLKYWIDNGAPND